MKDGNRHSLTVPSLCVRKTLQLTHMCNPVSCARHRLIFMVLSEFIHLYISTRSYELQYWSHNHVFHSFYPFRRANWLNCGSETNVLEFIRGTLFSPLFIAGILLTSHLLV